MKLPKVAVAMIAAACTLDVLAAFQRTIEAPGGVGNVTSLTNVLAEFNALSSDDRKSARIYLEKGTYNLSGVYMTGTHHLNVAGSQNGIFAGLGNGPEETILLGGGEAEAHGVLLFGGGGNSGFNTISNITITGGWTTGNGGGICGDSSVVYRNLIVSNNFAKGSGNGAGGGGCFKGGAFKCLFADNHVTERWGGGFLVSGRSNRQENEGQGAWDCTFVGNSAYQYGGGLAINDGGQCIRCSFTNNTTSGSGAGVYVRSVNYATYNGTPRKTKIIDGTFVGNRGAGAGVSSEAVLLPVSNCVFRLNSGNTTAVRGDMKDCTFECNTNAAGVIRNSSMERCVVRNNAVLNRYATAIDYCDADTPVLTNVNCRIESNGFLDEYGKLLYRKAYVNCTIVGNHMPNGGNFGYLSRDCDFWNCVLFGNKISTSTTRDVRTMDKDKNPLTVCMTNCVFATSDLAAGSIGAGGAVTHDGLGACRQLAKAALKLVDEPNGDYTPTTRSPLYGTGCADDWILSLVGDKDLAGNQRMFGGGLDIGAYECQLNKPGAMLIVW